MLSSLGFDQSLQVMCSQGLQLAEEPPCCIQPITHCWIAKESHTLALNDSQFKEFTFYNWWVKSTGFIIRTEVYLQLYNILDLWPLASQLTTLILNHFVCWK